MAKKAKEQKAEPEALPGVAGSAQGEVRDGPVTEPDAGEQQQAGGPVTGGENIERQQKDPDLKDNTGARP